MIKGYQKKITSIYEQIRLIEKRKLKQRKDEITQLYPSIIELDNIIKKMCLNLSMSILKGTTPEQVSNIKDEITDLRAKKYEMLVSNGYPIDYLSVHYQCNKCKDEGFIGSDKCSCYKEKLVKLYYESSEIQDSIRNSNFNSFNLNVFANSKANENEPIPRRNMENILEYIQGEYIANFDNIDTNLLFTGNSGTGKTFLSWCIAKELLDRGHLVVYKTSDDLIRDLREIRFENNHQLEELLVNCDLLIIDDLGAEQTTDFAITELFTLLNKKLLKHKKMLISTNYRRIDIAKIYTDRIYSRLLGNFKFIGFCGDDIRIKLNLAKNRPN